MDHKCAELPTGSGYSLRALRQSAWSLPLVIVFPNRTRHVGDHTMYPRSGLLERHAPHIPSLSSQRYVGQLTPAVTLIAAMVSNFRMENPTANFNSMSSAISWICHTIVVSDGKVFLHIVKPLQAIIKARSQFFWLCLSVSFLTWSWSFG